MTKEELIKIVKKLRPENNLHQFQGEVIEALEDPQSIFEYSNNTFPVKHFLDIFERRLNSLTNRNMVVKGLEEFVFNLKLLTEGDILLISVETDKNSLALYLSGDTLIGVIIH